MVGMDRALRIVTEMPLSELWDHNGPLNAQRVGHLDSADIQELLRIAPVIFVVANVGSTLEWLSIEQCYQFWKSEVRLRVCVPDKPIDLDQFPGAYCYLASEWSLGSSSLIVLERCH